jgi:hypothetical protein
MDPVNPERSPLPVPAGSRYYWAGRSRAIGQPAGRSDRASDVRRERAMKIEYFHASKFGNGAMVAEELKKQMAAKGVTVNVHHIRQARPDRLPTDLTD